YVDGVRLPRFLEPSYVPPAREGRGRLGLALLVLAGACVVAAPMAYWYVAGNPFTAIARSDLVKSALKYDVASVTTAPPQREQASPPAQSAGPVTRTRVTRWSDQMQEAVAQLPPVVEPAPEPPRASAAPQPAPNVPAYAFASVPTPSAVAPTPPAPAAIPP